MAENWHLPAMINKPLANMHRWAACLFVYCAAYNSAEACLIPGTTSPGIIFEHVPTDIDAPVIIEATIYDATYNVSYAHNGTFLAVTLMKARVDRVIKGPIDTKYLQIFAYDGGGMCSRVGIGHGIIVGTLRSDPERGVMLEATRKADMLKWSRDFFQQHVTLHAAEKCSKNEFGARECRVPGIGPE